MRDEELLDDDEESSASDANSSEEEEPPLFGIDDFDSSSDEIEDEFILKDPDEVEDED